MQLKQGNIPEKSGNTEIHLEHYPVEEEIIDLAEFLKTFGDPTRLKILFLLLHGEQSVQNISASLSVKQTAISHQLQLLRHLRLVRYRKAGRNVYYSLNDAHISQILTLGIEHIQEGNS